MYVFVLIFEDLSSSRFGKKATTENNLLPSYTDPLSKGVFVAWAPLRTFIDNSFTHHGDLVRVWWHYMIVPGIHFNYNTARYATDVLFIL